MELVARHGSNDVMLKIAWGLGRTLIVFVITSEHPLLVLTVSFTVYVPKFEYLYDGDF